MKLPKDKTIVRRITLPDKEKGQKFAPYSILKEAGMVKQELIFR
jgi:hypothetical protein